MISAARALEVIIPLDFADSPADSPRKFPSVTHEPDCTCKPRRFECTFSRATMKCPIAATPA